MSLRQLLVGEFVDIIEWTDEGPGTMAWRFPRPRNEIKHGAQLIVRPGQTAILVDQGRIADAFGPGRHELTTANMPLLSTLRGWKHGFASPFKADVVFLSTKRFVGQEWKTANPVILRDADLGPVRLRAYGSYSVRIGDERRFLQEIVGGADAYQLDQIEQQLRDVVVASVSSALAESGISIYKLAAQYAEVGERVQQGAAPQFKQYGLEVSQIVIENVSLPADVEATIDQKTRLSMISDLHRYAELQSVDALRDAARNPGGAAATAVGIGIGAVLGQRVVPPTIAGPIEPPPLPTAVWHYAAGTERWGPVAQEQLVSAITPTTLVWREGMRKWTAAGEVAELAALLKVPKHDGQ